MRFFTLMFPLFLAACAVGPTITDAAPTSPGGQLLAATDTPAVVVEGTATRPATPVVIEPLPTATQSELSSGDLTLIIFSPRDNDVVNEPQVELRGQANVEIVISVNEEIYVFPGGQDFSVIVPLEEGPNLIEITASDYAGNEVDLVLVVTYEIEE